MRGAFDIIYTLSFGFIRFNANRNFLLINADAGSTCTLSKKLETRIALGSIFRQACLHICRPHLWNMMLETFTKIQLKRKLHWRRIFLENRDKAA